MLFHIRTHTIQRDLHLSNSLNINSFVVEAEEEVETEL